VKIEPLNNESKILFNSKDVHYYWLSNFYPTLIYIKEKDAIAYCSEVLYKAYKYEERFNEIMQLTDPSKAKKIKSQSADTVSEEEASETTTAIAKMENVVKLSLIITDLMGLVIVRSSFVNFRMLL